MELGLSFGDLSKDSNSKHQNASINNKDDHGLVFCMAFGLNSTVANQESQKPHETYQTLCHNDGADHHQEKFLMGTAAVQLDLLPVNPSHTGSLFPAIAWSNSINILGESSSGQLGLVLQPAVVAGGVREEEELLSVNDVMETERAYSKASTDEDENSRNSRKKLRLSKQQSAYLEQNFKEHSTLNPKQKLALANQLNLTPRQVEVWFQNRRARTKLKQTEVDCEYLKRFSDSLTVENRRLQKEIQELRALNSSNPFCMQLPATTLTMCPSCERVATTTTAIGKTGTVEKTPKVIQFPVFRPRFSPFSCSPDHPHHSAPS